MIKIDYFVQYIQKWYQHKATSSKNVINQVRKPLHPRCPFHNGTVGIGQSIEFIRGNEYAPLRNFSTVSQLYLQPLHVKRRKRYSEQHCFVEIQCCSLWVQSEHGHDCEYESHVFEHYPDEEKYPTHMD